MKRRIAIDTNPLYVTQAGIARYVRGLLAGLKQINDPLLDITTLAWETENLDYKQPLRAAKTLYRELVWYRHTAPRLLKKNAIDLVHITQLAPIRSPVSTKRVCTLHDCAVLRFPEKYRRWQRTAGRLCIREALQADRIICISEFTANEAMALLDIPANKLEVIYLGNTFAENKIEPQIPNLKLPQTFLLFVGSLEPGKNLQLLSETYRIADERKLDIPPLVIVGTRWQGMKEEKPHRNWIYLGRQPDSTVAYLYQHAVALLFPSRYEGFGLPILEAMSSNCPIISSKLASIPEVAGDAALYAEQTPEDYLLKIAELLRDDSLSAQMRKAGQRQASKFSWASCANQTIDLYKSLL